MNFAPFRSVETTSLLLRWVEDRDAPAISRLMTPAVSRWLASWPVPFTDDLAMERIKSARAGAALSNILPFAITLKQTGAVIGWVAVEREADHGPRGSLGYWLGEAYHGNGYMREAVSPAVAAGFALLGLSIIEAGAQPENTASFAVMAVCGMQKSGERMVYAPSRHRDELCVFYELQRDDFWSARQGVDGPLSRAMTR
jgi:ribosomal-protein-alanine N-acetyltransferase